MPFIKEEVRADIRGALAEVIVLMEAMDIGLEMTLSKTSEDEVRISVSALARFRSDAEKAARELKDLLEKLLDTSEEASPELDDRIKEIIRFYADAANHEQKRGLPSKVARDAGAKARALQEALAEGAAE